MRVVTVQSGSVNVTYLSDPVVLLDGNIEMMMMMMMIG